jgi:DNA-3-methyladenine glycosylase II
MSRANPDGSYGAQQLAGSTQAAASGPGSIGAMSSKTTRRPPARALTCPPRSFASARATERPVPLGASPARRPSLVTSADAIRRRMIEGLGWTLTPAGVLAADELTLRGFGLSGQKIRYVRAIADAAEIFERLEALDDAEAVAELTAITGVGRWTAETYLMFSEGRLDFLPAGDIALQEGLRLLESGDARLSEKALYLRAEAWRPYRGVAALMLWAVYQVARGRVTEASAAGSITVVGP